MLRLTAAGIVLLSAPATAWSQVAESAPPAMPEAAGAASALLPHDLSPWGMFVTADIVVQAVISGLAFASVVTWTVLIAKSIELSGASRQQHRAYAQIDRAASMDALAQNASIEGTVAAFVAAAQEETRLSAEHASEDPDGLQERIASRLERLEAAAGRSMVRGIGLLATIGATAPFVGLFGTVWGIMNSFIGISKSHTTNLAVVAPGIAEALLATAIGLVAAIPAVVIYNQFTRRIAAYKAQLSDTAAALLRLVSRDLSRSRMAPERPEYRARLGAAE
ncbi:MAG TPA: tonB-system energizer ExbB [Ferrovibrio sp.]|uniref:tonB-system energizer ExbB n=1 Tax=Ferrovibrio sp. TaxID=1917215 RepID=UPI002ED502CC